MKILLTGGLGYIGSHIAFLLNKKAVIIDNKNNSSLNYKKYLPCATVYKKSVNKNNLGMIFKNHDIEGVIHLAGLKAVNDSIADPIKYYKSNVSMTLELLESMDKFNVKKIIFSSSATVYGNKHKSPLDEKMNLESVNPYGSTKILIEQLINDFTKSKPNFKSISLRYFNPIGANLKAGLADQPLGEPQNLLPALINSVKNHKKFKIFGSNYNTKDGTCIRDYIHIKDLAKAHLLAFQKLKNHKGYEAINIGLGKGASVLEIIKLFEKANKIKVKYNFTSRRKGDADISFASIKKAKAILNWKPQFNYLDMVKDAWEAGSKN